MKNMTLSNIAKACHGEFCGTRQEAEKCISGVKIDSRKIEENDLFIATKGERVDGHDFISRAYEDGACCVICEKRPLESKCAYILVESSFQALKDIASFYRDQLDIKVIGITGSVGKTSTKEVVASVLSSKFCVLKTLGNFNNEVGLPLTVLRIREEHEVAVLEMGISDFGEMDRLSAIAKPDICVITNIGFCHLENLKTQNGILEAKSEMFQHMKPDGAIILNGDDKLLASLKKVNGVIPKHFGTNTTNDLYVKDVEGHGLHGSSFTICDEEECYQVTTTLPGRHVIMNCAAAALIGKTLGLSTDEITEGISKVQPVAGRSHLIDTENLTIIDDCYNANPVSMKEALELLSMADTRTVAILGDMFELGSHSDEMHKEVGAYAVKKAPDRILMAGENSRHMYEGAIEELHSPEHAAGGTGVTMTEQDILYFEDREALKNALPGILRKGDSVLVKASHGMQYEKLVEYLKTWGKASDSNQN